MAEDILVRRVPERVHAWIDQERQRRKMTKREFVVSVLEDACNGDAQLSLPLVPPPIVEVKAALPFTFIDLFAGVGGFRIPL